MNNSNAYEYYNSSVTTIIFHIVLSYSLSFIFIFENQLFFEYVDSHVGHQYNIVQHINSKTKVEQSTDVEI